MTCYFQVNTSELYDVVNYNAKEKSGVSVQALRILWDQKKDHPSIPANKQRIQKQNDSAPVIPPSLPPKNQTKNRKLIGTVSVDTTSFSQVWQKWTDDLCVGVCHNLFINGFSIFCRVEPWARVYEFTQKLSSSMYCYCVFKVLPPVPKRGLPMGFIQSGSLPDTTTHPNETKAESNASKELRGNTNPAQTSDKNVFSTVDESDLSYTELSQMESRSKSLPQLDNSTVEDEYSNQLSSAPFTTSPSNSPSLGRRVTCHTYSLHDPRAPRLSDCSPDPQNDDSEGLMSNPLYQTSEEPGRSSDRQVDGMYAEVSQSSKSAGQPDNTYELVAGESASTVQSNTYESLADIKPKTVKSTWGKSVSKKQ